MRRKDREITEINDIIGIFDRAEVLRIALNNGDFPYILPVNFGYERVGENLVLFFHGSNEGEKHAIIEKDNRVTFEVDCGHKLIIPDGKEACSASFAYESIIGQGIMEKAAEEEKPRLLSALLMHYGIVGYKFNSVLLAKTAVYKIKVLRYTAKRRQADK